MMQFSNVKLSFACFVPLLISLFVIEQNVYRWILFCCLFACMFFLKDGRLGKVEYFIVIKGKVFSSAGQDFEFAVDFRRNTVRLTYTCPCKCPSVPVFRGNSE